MDIFPKLESNRLILSDLKADDIKDIVKYASNKNISDTTLNIPFPYSEKDAIYWINLSNQGFQNGTSVIFGIRLKKDKKFVGGIGLGIDKKHHRAEMGFWVAEKFWGKGIATEASALMIKYGFNKLKLNKITSSHFRSNPASGKVMLKNGMTKEGELNEHILKNSKFHDLIVYGITRKEF